MDTMLLSVEDLGRLEHMLDIVVEMHDAFGISLEEAAGRIDRYAQGAKRFVGSDWFFHDSAKEMAGEIYYGRDERRDQA